MFFRKFSECRKLRDNGNLTEAKIVLQTIDLITEDSFLFPKQIEKSAAKQNRFYEKFQQNLRQLRSEIFQMHSNLWNDGVNRHEKNELQLKTNELDRLFRCTFDEDNGEKNLIEKQIQTFANYCLQSFLHDLLEKPMRLIIDEDLKTTNVKIRLENDDENDENRMKQFEQILNDFKGFFHVLNVNLLSRTIKIQPTNDQSVSFFKRLVR